MGATSSEGTGHGSAEAYNKGPGNNRNIFVPTVSPHIVCTGRATLTSGGENAHTKLVSLPAPLPFGVDKYNIFLQVLSATLDNDSNVTTADVVVDVTDANNDDGQFYQFTIHGTFNNTVVMWMVVLNGIV